MLLLYKVNLDSTDRSYVPPIWLRHHRCVRTHFHSVHYDSSTTITALFQRWRFGFLLFYTNAFAYTSCILPVSSFSRYHTTRMSKAILYTSVCFFCLQTP
jgi:hypothetical protein